MQNYLKRREDEVLNVPRPAFFAELYSDLVITFYKPSTLTATINGSEIWKRLFEKKKNIWFDTTFIK